MLLQYNYVVHNCNVIISPQEKIKEYQIVGGVPLKELGFRLIFADSPQARGRGERIDILKVRTILNYLNSFVPARDESRGSLTF